MNLLVRKRTIIAEKERGKFSYRTRAETAKADRLRKEGVTGRGAAGTARILKAPQSRARPWPPQVLRRVRPGDGCATARTGHRCPLARARAWMLREAAGSQVSGAGGRPAEARGHEWVSLPSPLRGEPPLSRGTPPLCPRGRRPAQRQV